MPITETTLLLATLAAAVGLVLGILGTVVWSARRQAAAALVLEQERQLKALAEQQRADTLRQRDELGRLLDSVRAEAASAAVSVEPGATALAVT